VHRFGDVSGPEADLQRTKPKEITLRPVRSSIAARAAILGLALVPLIGIQLALAGGTPREVIVSGRPPSGEDFDATKIRISFSRVARSLSKPVFVTHAGDDSGRLFIVEQGGRIKILRNGSILGTPFLNISTKVSKGSEQGLLGLAFHPNYASNHTFYIYYTDTNGDIVIARHLTTGNPDIGSATGVTLLKIGHPSFTNHNGGMLAFGPDHYLYAGTGDGGSSGDPGNHGQSLNTLLGKILRIDIDHEAGGKKYAIPPSNPYVGRTGLDEIWAFGLRNPWRFTFDQRTGDLWIGDVGQNRYEEINRSKAVNGVDAGKGLNYGWRVLEGNACYNPSSGCSTSGKTPPMAVYGHGLGCSVTGGYVYRGLAYRGLVGGYLFGDFCSGRVWALRAHGPNSQAPVLMADTGLAISSFGEGPDGTIYVTDLGSGDVWAIVAQYR
jgi:glucose/arabinose dehydrogenase